MIDLETSFVWGLLLSELRTLMVETEEMYFGLSATSLYGSDKEQIEIGKQKYIETLRPQVEKVNNKVKDFNRYSKVCFGRESAFQEIPQVDFTKIKQIVSNHRGDYAVERNPETSFSKHLADELMARSDSASSLARKHTVMKLRNCLVPLRIETANFFKHLDKYKEPYKEYLRKKNVISPKIAHEIEKSIACYSINLKGEAVFIIARAIENLCGDLLKHIKRKNAKELDKYKIKEIEAWDFDTKLTFLYRKLKRLNDSQYSKALSLKWDRNTLGHKIGKLDDLGKNAESNIMTGINLIILLEEKLRPKTRRMVRNPSKPIQI